MYSGFLDQRVTVTAIQRVFDGRGGWTNKEVTVGTFWAAVMPLTVYEQSQYSALDTDVNTKIYMRYNPTFTSSMSIKFRGKRYRVQGIINPAYQDEYMQLVVSEADAPVTDTPTVITRTEKVTFAGKTAADGDESRKIFFGVTY